MILYNYFPCVLITSHPLNYVLNSNNIRTFYNYLKHSAWLSPSSRNRNRLCRRTATSSHFLSSRKHYIAHGNNPRLTRKTLTLLLLYSKTIFKKKTQLFWSLLFYWPSVACTDIVSGLGFIVCFDCFIVFSANTRTCFKRCEPPPF